MRELRGEAEIGNQGICNLHGIERGAFAELVAADPEGEAVLGSRRIRAQAADKDFVAV